MVRGIIDAIGAEIGNGPTSGQPPTSTLQPLIGVARLPIQFPRLIQRRHIVSLLRIAGVADASVVPAV
jgi:hypothetical protein